MAVEVRMRALEMKLERTRVRMGKEVSSWFNVDICLEKVNLLNLF